MSNETPKPPDRESSIEHFGHEIEELEAAGKGSAVRWVVIALLVVAGVVAIYFTSSGGKRARAASGGVGSNVIETYEPYGRLADVPTRFRWESISGRKNYLFSLSARGASMPLFQRTTRESTLVLTEEETKHLERGRGYQWEVKALDLKGASIAVGRGSFDL